MNAHDKRKILNTIGRIAGTDHVEATHETNAQVTVKITIGEVTLHVYAHVSDRGLVEIFALHKWRKCLDSLEFWRIVALDLAQEINDAAAVAHHN